MHCPRAAQVFVTCGTADKRAFLLEAFPGLRADHIGDSRSTSFEALVKRQTGGAGVHLALNSLADDKLQVLPDQAPAALLPHKFCSLLPNTQDFCGDDVRACMHAC